ncbi:hypothetical protein V502_01855 [Pseudogymnoascus sp. VKM F-4520 (FW-2644)]|nr:hypothetical protein V502_01855 [Pseudogymnoascus sp. VKM F-4520 (FW-2644)]
MATLFPRFERVDTVYKALNGTPFSTAVLVPKTLKSVQKTCPLLVHFHGGGLFMGTNLEPRFLPLELAEAKNAIIVSPTYRLIPEATGSDILDDLRDFWEWTLQSLSTFVAEKWPGLILDLARIAVSGESAGGYLALQSGFLFPSADIKVVMGQYCAIYPDIKWRPGPGEGAVEANEFIEAYLAQIKPGDIRLTSPFPEGMDLGNAMRQSGRYNEWIGEDERLRLDYCLRTVENIPPIWIMQGIEDSRVPKESTDTMVARIRESRPEAQVLYSVQPGEHGFDMYHGLDESYIAEGIKMVTKYWP